MRKITMFMCILFFTVGFFGCSKENVQSKINNEILGEVSSKIRLPIPIKSIPFYFKVWNNDNQEFDLQRMKVKVWYTDIQNLNGWLQEFEDDYNNFRFDIQNNDESQFYNRIPSQSFEILPAAYNPITKEFLINIQYDKLAFLEVEFLPSYEPNNQFYEWSYVHFTSTSLSENHITINHFFDCP